MHPPLGNPDHDTMELFLGDAGAPGTAPEPPAPVFVDTSGRRQRRVRRWGYLLVVPAAAYVVLLISTLLGGPTLQSPFLPSAQAPHTHAPEGAPAGRTANPSPRSAASGSPRPTPVASRGAAPSSAATRTGPTAPDTGPGPTKAATQSPGPVPPAPGGGRGRGTAPPGQGGGKPTGRP